MKRGILFLFLASLFIVFTSSVLSYSSVQDVSWPAGCALNQTEEVEGGFIYWIQPGDSFSKITLKFEQPQSKMAEIWSNPMNCMASGKTMPKNFVLHADGGLLYVPDYWVQTLEKKYKPVLKDDQVLQEAARITLEENTKVSGKIQVASAANEAIAVPFQFSLRKVEPNPFWTWLAKYGWIGYLLISLFVFLFHLCLRLEKEQILTSKRKKEFVLLAIWRAILWPLWIISFSFNAGKRKIIKAWLKYYWVEAVMLISTIAVSTFVFVWGLDDMINNYPHSDWMVPGWAYIILAVLNLGKIAQLKWSGGIRAATVVLCILSSFLPLLLGGELISEGSYSMITEVLNFLLGSMMLATAIVNVIPFRKRKEWPFAAMTTT